ncbi:sigma-70 family RNA polymerase sigma factor [Thiomicrorhabdus indica]|uniref:sigma-70 family RNA polymerase sigma factor n=1 Tax=Thiomicrorhabdus indica TaxID=2267253 RepID=UPI001981E019|nr:sigma-70 family RNA polymerase sigma factor [Thiomicrorhabdus indica]
MSDPTFDYEAALMACASGKRTALTELYQQEASRLLTVVFRILKNRALAEDIVHDAFLKIWANAKSYQPELGSGRGWIYTLTRNLALNALEKHQRQVQTDPEFLTDILDKMQQQTSSNKNPMDDSLQHKTLYDCMENLSDESKQCILHSYVEGYTQEEISNLLNKPLGTVKSWIRRSLQALKECLQ